MRQSKYVRLPSGLTLTDRFSPILRDAYNLPQSGPPPLPSDGGGLIAPPRMETLIVPPPHDSSPGSGGGKSYVANPPFSPPKGLTYAEFKQIMQNKIVEKLNETPKLVVPPPPDRAQYVMNLHNQYGHKSEQEKSGARGQTYTTFGGSQFYQSLFGGKNGFSPLSFLLSGRGGQSPFFVPVPIVVPPPPPPPPGPKCYTNPSVVSVEATEEKFKTSFETIAAHRDFVAKVNFAGDLNCKIEIDGKFILAYATPQKEKEVNIIDANSFFSGDADELFDTSNGTESKPTYIVYGPIR
ncbi:ground-like domain protein [Ancylostoma ceylanicum]|uniref:Ground-like domain protein n=1 Tax=Ancylostoma ceylanicum TaxID=53326 RepID=A0A0D6M294_9BILA|nr:ground-like domain protein [Ancylostoma ceylanicum]